MAEGLTLDAGILIAADRGDRRAWRLLDTASHDATRMVTPVVVVAQVWRGAKNANLARALRATRIEVLDDTLAREAGLLCGQAGTHDAIDAIVVASAARRGDTVITTDISDLRPLAAAAGPHVKIRDLNDL